MAKLKSTKYALLISAVSLLLCVTMLVGSTYAWYSDSVTSTGNVIHSGTLDVALKKWDANVKTWFPANDKPLFDYDCLEPGSTEVVNLCIENIGSLALQWQASVKSESGLSDIADYIHVYVKTGYDEAEVKDHISSVAANPYIKELVSQGEKVYTLREFVKNLDTISTGKLAAGQKGYIGIVLQMDYNIPMEYSNLELGDKFKVVFIATQVSYESDSFDNNYDADAIPPKVFVITNDGELDNAFLKGGQGFIHALEIPNVNATLNEDKTLVLNMDRSTLTIGGESEYIIVNKGTLELSGDGLLQSNMTGAIENWGNLYVNNLNINVTGIKYGFHVKGGQTEINNLVLRAERGGLNVQGGKLTVNSGSFNFSGYYDTTAKKWYNGQVVYAVGVDSEVVINGGDFRFTGGTGGSQRVLCAQDGATIIVNGGTFGKGNSKTKSTWLWEYDSTPNNGVDNRGDIVIYGGTFQFDPSACVAEGYKATQGADGWWTVSKI